MATKGTRFGLGVGLPGRVWKSGQPEFFADVALDENFVRNKFADDIGVKTGFAFPLLVGNDVAAVLEFFTPKAVTLDSQSIDVMSHIGAQLGRVIARTTADDPLHAAPPDAHTPHPTCRPSAPPVLAPAVMRGVGGGGGRGGQPTHASKKSKLVGWPAPPPHPIKLTLV